MCVGRSCTPGIRLMPGSVCDYLTRPIPACGKVGETLTVVGSLGSFVTLAVLSQLMDVGLPDVGCADYFSCRMFCWIYGLSLVVNSACHGP